MRLFSHDCDIVLLWKQNILNKGGLVCLVTHSVAWADDV